jgi:hypothetical protein
MTSIKQIKDLSTLPLLITAGNALLTFVSIKTGKHYTFHIKEAEAKNMFVVNHNNRRIGNLIDMAFHIHPKAFTLSDEQQAMAWIWKNVLQPNKLTKNIRVYHNGRCAKCGRTLTVPASIESGIGPECSKIIFKS